MQPGHLHGVPDLAMSQEPKLPFHQRACGRFTSIDVVSGWIGNLLVQPKASSVRSQTTMIR